MARTKPSSLLLPALQKAARRGGACRILFVCTGNICRSPLAYAVFGDLLSHKGLAEHFELESAGTHGYHIGENADPRMRSCSRSHGVDLDHPARKLQDGDFAYYDLLLAMDGEHLEIMRRRAPDLADSERILLYRQFDPVAPGSDVPDPYYGSASAFEAVWQIVERCSAALLQEILATLPTI